MKNPIALNTTCLSMLTWATLGWVVASINGAGLASGQQRNHSYLSFSRSISPTELNQLLGSSNAVQKKIVSDKIAEMVKEKFKTLTPDQKKRLAEISQDYVKGRSSLNLTQRQQALERAISEDKDLREAAKELRSSLRNQEFARDAIDQSAVERGIRDEVQQRLQRELTRYQSEFLQNPNGSSPSNPGNSSQPDIGKPGFPGNSYVPGGNATEPGSSRNSSDPTKGRTGNPFRVGPGNQSPQIPFSNTNPPNQRFGPDNPGTSGNGFSTGPPNSNPNNSIPQSSTGPFGGFSDDGKGSGRSQSSNPGMASASGQNKGLPKESIGHRFNRMVMNSVEKAMERKVGAEGGGGEQSFRRLLNKFVDSVAKSNPNISSRINSGSSGIMNNIRRGFQRGRSRFRMPDWNRMGTGSSFGGGGMGMSMPSFSPRGMLTFILILGAVIAVIVFAVKKTPLAQYLGLQNPAPTGGPPPELQVKIQDYDEIVQLIDRFTLWLYGRKASWWNSKKVQNEVAKANPELAGDIQAMMDIYDAARYARPDQPVSTPMVNKVKTTLRQLRDYAQEKDKARSQLQNPEPKTA